MANLFKQAYLPYVLFIVGAILIFVWARVNRTEGFADAAPAPYKLHMYYAEWCPHCHKALPEFAKLGAIQTIGGKHVECKAIEAEKNPEQVLSKVSGYPTVHLFDPKGQLVEEYQGERTTAGFQAFLEKALQPKA
jgi:thiol-disulfide isomerase/thioredoxin